MEKKLFTGVSTVVCPMARSWSWVCFFSSVLLFCIYLKMNENFDHKKQLFVIEEFFCTVSNKDPNLSR